jgi:hypothetical protein
VLNARQLRADLLDVHDERSVFRDVDVDDIW